MDTTATLPSQEPFVMPTGHHTASRTTRRGFLGCTAAAAAAPYVITSRALGDAVTAPASDRIVMGGIGIGNMGSGDQNAFLGRGDVQYVAICDVREQVRHEAKARVDQRYGNDDCTAFLDFRELLARDDIDAVHVATPDHWHAAMTIAACREGKDVYLQKPETLTLREGPLMIAAGRRYGRVFSGGSQRVLDDYRGIVDPVWAGEIGRVVSIDVAVGGPSQPCYLPAMDTPPDIDWNLWLGPAPWQPFHPGRCSGGYGTGGNTWRSYVDYSGGSLTDWGAHHFGGALFAADLREAQPMRAVFHSAGEAGRPYVSLEYPGGVWLHHNRPAELRHHAGPTVSHGDAIVIEGDGTAREPVAVPLYHGPLYQESSGHGTGGIYGDFIECVKTRQRPFRDIELAVNTMTAPHLIGIAYRLQRSLTWNREKQEFVGDEEANRLCDRARREPWIV
jgi:predicted dehydrogenase